jgi:hypothetical protein
LVENGFGEELGTGVGNGFGGALGVSVENATVGAAVLPLGPLSGTVDGLLVDAANGNGEGASVGSSDGTDVGVALDGVPVGVGDTNVRSYAYVESKLPTCGPTVTAYAAPTPNDDVIKHLRAVDDDQALVAQYAELTVTLGVRFV